MSDSFNNQENELETVVETTDNSVSTTEIDDAESTVFSAPLEHKKVKAKKPLVIFGATISSTIISIIAACLAVAILVTGTLLIIKFIPEMTNEGTVSSVFEDIKVIDVDSKQFTNVSVTNKNGEFKFATQQISATNTDGETETTTYWTIEGIDVSKMSSSSTNSIISAAASITALRTIDTKTPSECGFDNPKYKISVKSSAADPYTVLVGDVSTDGLGSYMMVEGKDTIYVASDDEFADFDFTLLDLTDKTSIPITKFTSNTAENKTEDGTYAFFDSLTLSGKQFPETITIVNNKEESDSAALLPYLITTPTERYVNTENLSSLVALFSTEVAVAGNYALDVTDETMKLFGLDNPDVVVTMTINGEARTFKFAYVDSEYCAVVYDGAPMIRKIITSTQAFLALKSEDLYYKNLFMNSINDIQTLELDDQDGTVKFDISYTEDENQNKTYKVIANGKEIVAKNFQDFYADFVCIQCVNFKTQELDAKPDGTITFVFKDNSKQVIKFYRSSATEYQYSIDGKNMGNITSTSFNKIISNIKSIANGEEPV